VLYFLLSLSVLSFPVTLLRIYFKEKASLMHNLADSLVVGSGFVFAMSFTTMTEAVLGMQSIGGEEDIGAIVAYLVVFGLLCGLFVTLVAVAEGRTSDKRLRFLEKHCAEGEEDDRTLLQRELYMCGVTAHTMCVVAAQGVSMACAMTFYRLVWVLAGWAATDGGKLLSVYKPLGPLPAFIMYVVAVAFQLCLGHCLVVAKTRVKKRLEAIDCDAIPTKLDDAAVAFLDASTQTWMTAVGTALAWVSGQALHNFVLALWVEHVASDASLGDGAKLAIAFAYSVLITLLAVVAILFLRPKAKAEPQKVHPDHSGATAQPPPVQQLGKDHDDSAPCSE